MGVKDIGGSFNLFALPCRIEQQYFHKSRFYFFICDEIHNKIWFNKGYIVGTLLEPSFQIPSTLEQLLRKERLSPWVPISLSYQSGVMARIIRIILEQMVCTQMLKVYNCQDLLKTYNIICITQSNSKLQTDSVQNFLTKV